MAMGLLRNRLAQDGLEDEVIVSSAGVYGLDGSAASPPSVDVLAERGIDISQHRAHTTDKKDIAEADLVLVMEEAQRRTLFYNYPEQLHKIFLLSEMSGDYRDVKDPYRRPREEYERCAKELTALIDNGYPAILKRLKVALPGTR
jgi:protein-tyrosine-phosphatase